MTGSPFGTRCENRHIGELTCSVKYAVIYFNLYYIREVWSMR